LFSFLSVFKIKVKASRNTGFYFYAPSSIATDTPEIYTGQRQSRRKTGTGKRSDLKERISKQLVPDRK
jgi:hypothetical protein